MAQLNANFNSTRLTPQGEYRASWAMNAGVHYEILEGKLSMTATITDIFKSMRRELHLNASSLKQTLINSRDAQVIYFGLTYYFGSPSKNKKDDQIKYEDGL